MRKRTVFCVRTVSGEERVLHPVECKHLLKPKPVVPCNRDVPCGREWSVSHWEECPVTCGGGVRSRTVTCTLPQKTTCDLSTKPRSRSLCALQSCPNSSLRRQPGPSPKHQHVYPPNINSTQTPSSPTRTPMSTTATSTASVRKIVTTKETTTAFISTTTSPSTTGIIDAEDYEFNVMMGGKKGKKGLFPAKKDKERNEEDSEEGSTPNVVIYTPGYDYVVEDRTTEEERIIDLDDFTKSPKSLPQLTTPAPHTLVTSTLQTSPLTIPLTRAASTTTTYATPLTSTEKWRKTTYYLPKSHTATRTTTTRINLRSNWTQRVPQTTPLYETHSVTSKNELQTKQVPATTQRKALTTSVSPQPTVKIIKVKKPAVLPKKNNSVSRANKKATPRSKSSSAKNQNQQPGNLEDISDNDQSNLMAGEPVTMELVWIVGNWSECSTTCGIGAIWRTVTCSSQNDDDCASMKRPEPARTCHLQPCAIWQSGSWSKCPDNCVLVGRRYRDVQCVDSQSKRLLRPFHCQATSSRPVSTLTCPHKPCMTWSVSPWGPCSGSCGEGTRERLVYCPEPHRCSTTLKPNSTEICSLKPCTHWNAEEWEECSVSCGGGQQQRDVHCLSEQDSAVMPNSLCEKISKPVMLRKCNMQECKTNTGPVCRKNTMSSRFCDKLKLLGRCSLRSVQRQCCVTCQLKSELEAS